MSGSSLHTMGRRAFFAVALGTVTAIAAIAQIWPPMIWALLVVLGTPKHSWGVLSTPMRSWALLGGPRRFRASLGTPGRP